MRHTNIDVPCCMNQAEIEVEPFGNVLQVEWVERDAVAANTRAGIKGLKRNNFFTLHGWPVHHMML
jgi:hypothetical protein